MFLFQLFDATAPFHSPSTLRKLNDTGILILVFLCDRSCSVHPEASLAESCLWVLSPPSRHHFRHVCSSAYEKRQRTQGLCMSRSTSRHEHQRTSFIIVVMYLYVLTQYRFSFSRNRQRHFQSPLSIYCSLHLWNLAVVMFVRARF